LLSTAVLMAGLAGCGPPPPDPALEERAARAIAQLMPFGKRHGRPLDPAEYGRVHLAERPFQGHVVTCGTDWEGNRAVSLNGVLTFAESPISGPTALYIWQQAGC
jgi:hypothetical protein